MRTFRLVLIALVFLLHSGAGMASSVRICCMDAHCPVADCVAMGCSADALPPLAVGASPQALVMALREPLVAAGAASAPSRVEEIWTPPD